MGITSSKPENVAPEESKKGCGTVENEKKKDKIITRNKMGVVINIVAGTSVNISNNTINITSSSYQQNQRWTPYDIDREKLRKRRPLANKKFMRKRERECDRKPEEPDAIVDYRVIGESSSSKQIENFEPVRSDITIKQEEINSSDF